VVLLRDRNGDPVLGVVVEIQRAIDERKRWSWPVYLAALRAQAKCSVALLVVCLDDETAAWAQQPIDLGFGQAVQPFAVGPNALPSIREPETASRLPELAVLSAMTHGNDEPDGLDTVLAAMVALARFDDERARFYLDLILARLNERVRRALEAMRMQKYEYQSEFAKKYYGQGKQEGFAEGLSLGKVEGKAEGEARGKAEGEAQAILAVLEARGLEVPAKVRKAVLSCTDLAQLDAWVRAAVSVPSAAALLTPVAPSPAVKKAKGRRNPA
jgi:flagellar biosynthesis/type III secretory pathway protein FliH